MKIKIVFLAVLCSFGLFAFQSCYKPKPPVIGLLMDDFSTERWVKDTTIFIKSVNDLGGKVICLAANRDPAKQLEQAKFLIKKKVKVLVILPVDLRKAAEIVKEAKAAHIPVISYDRLILNALPDYYISFDNIKVGEMQASYVLNRLRFGKGKIALIGGPKSDYNSSFLHLGQIGILQPYIEKGDITIVYDIQASTWSDTAGYRLAKDCLKENGNKIDAFIAGNDLLARGIIQALEEKGLAGKVLVTGQDGDSKACENIMNGKQSMTVYKPIEEIADVAANAAISLAKGEAVKATMTTNNGIKLIPSILISPLLVNKGNIEMQINPKRLLNQD